MPFTDAFKAQAGNRLASAEDAGEYLVPVGRGLPQLPFRNVVDVGKLPLVGIHLAEGGVRHELAELREVRVEFGAALSIARIAILLLSPVVDEPGVLNLNHAVPSDVGHLEPNRRHTGDRHLHTWHTPRELLPEPFKLIH